MSYNGSGTFVINSSGQPVVTGTVISSTAFNALTADLATGLSTAITKDGQTTTTSRILFAQGISSTLVTDATSATTGSIITAGGISTQKALWVGTTSTLVGNVGIGVTPPAVKLDVYSASDVTIGQFFSGGGASKVFPLKWGRSDGGVYGYLGQDCSVDNAIIVGTPGNFPLAFYQNGLERARINASGLGIGMTPSNVLDITQTQNAGSIASLKNASTGVSGLAYFSSKNSISNMNMAMFSTGYSPSGMVRADGGYLGCNGAGGITINTEYAQPIYFGINSVEVARFNTGGWLKVSQETGASLTSTDHRLVAMSKADGVINTFFYSSTLGGDVGMYCVDAGAYNAAAAGIKAGKSNATGRSINAGGTINASGADYAEYMTKADDCGVIAKGSIAGVNDDGKLTDKFADAHSFVVKSTDPSYVGGDVWGSEDALGVENPSGRDKTPTEEEVAAHRSILEAARQTVDRIAFSGQVPVNVTGATVGDYIVPVAGPDGGIAGEAVTNPTFDQYRAAVGRVWKILEDGRAFVSVKVS